MVNGLVMLKVIILLNHVNLIEHLIGVCTKTWNYIISIKIQKVDKDTGYSSGNTFIFFDRNWFYPVVIKMR